MPGSSPQGIDPGIALRVNRMPSHLPEMKDCSQFAGQVAIAVIMRQRSRVLTNSATGFRKRLYNAVAKKDTKVN